MSYFSQVSTTEFPISNLGAFGDFQISELNPGLHLAFATGTRDQLIANTGTNGGTVSTSNSRLVIATSTNINGSSIVKSIKPLVYRPGQGVTIRFTALFESSATNSKQYFGAGNDVDGYFYGYNGTTFGILYRCRSVDTWIARSSWNGDSCDGNGPSGFNWNPNFGTPLMIKYPYLGYGNVEFFVQNPDTSRWILCHTIQYANSSVETQISNPMLSVYGQVLNQGNSTNLRIFVGSVGAFIDGARQFFGPQFAIDGSKAAVTTEVPILTLKNSTTVNGVTNRGLARLRQIGFASDGGNGYGIVRVKKGATLTGASYAAISGTTADGGTTITSAQSIMAYDTTATAVSGGTTVFNLNVGRSSAISMDLTQYDIYIAPGETLTFTVFSGASATCDVAVNWQEDVQ